MFVSWPESWASFANWATDGSDDPAARQTGSVHSASCGSLQYCMFLRAGSHSPEWPDVPTSPSDTPEEDVMDGKRESRHPHVQGSSVFSILNFWPTIIQSFSTSQYFSNWRRSVATDEVWLILHWCSSSQACSSSSAPCWVSVSIHRWGEQGHNYKLSYFQETSGSAALFHLRFIPQTLKKFKIITPQKSL